MHSLINLETLDVGFDRDRVLAVSFDVGGIPISTDQIRNFYSQLFERAKNLPGVQSAALASFPPVSGFVRGVNVAVEGRQLEPVETSHALFNSVTPGYFQTMGIPLLAGRDFTDHDAPGPGSAVIINRTMARHYFGDETPLGKRIRFVEGNRPPMEIIGVAADSKYNNLREQASDFFMFPRRGEKTGISSSWWCTHRKTLAALQVRFANWLGRSTVPFRSFTWKRCASRLTSPCIRIG